MDKLQFFFNILTEPPKDELGFIDLVTVNCLHELKSPESVEINHNKLIEKSLDDIFFDNQNDNIINSQMNAIELSDRLKLSDIALNKIKNSKSEFRPKFINIYLDNSSSLKNELIEVTIDLVKQSENYDMSLYACDVIINLIKNKSLKKNPNLTKEIIMDLFKSLKKILPVENYITSYYASSRIIYLFVSLCLNYSELLKDDDIYITLKEEVINTIIYTINERIIVNLDNFRKEFTYYNKVFFYSLIDLVNENFLPFEDKEILYLNFIKFLAKEVSISKERYEGEYLSNYKTLLSFTKTYKSIQNELIGIIKDISPLGFEDDIIELLKSDELEEDLKIELFEYLYNYEIPDLFNKTIFLIENNTFSYQSNKKIFDSFIINTKDILNLIHLSNIKNKVIEDNYETIMESIFNKNIYEFENQEAYCIGIFNMLNNQPTLILSDFKDKILKILTDSIKYNSIRPNILEFIIKTSESKNEYYILLENFLDELLDYLIINYDNEKDYDSMINNQNLISIIFLDDKINSKVTEKTLIKLLNIILSNNQFQYNLDLEILIKILNLIENRGFSRSSKNILDYLNKNILRNEFQKSLFIYLWRTKPKIANLIKFLNYDFNLWKIYIYHLKKISRDKYKYILNFIDINILNDNWDSKANNLLKFLSENDIPSYFEEEKIINDFLESACYNDDENIIYNSKKIIYLIENSLLNEILSEKQTKIIDILPKLLEKNDLVKIKIIKLIVELLKNQKDIGLSEISKENLIQCFIRFLTQNLELIQSSSLDFIYYSILNKTNIELFKIKKEALLLLLMRLVNNNIDYIKSDILHIINSLLNIKQPVVLSHFFRSMLINRIIYAIGSCKNLEIKESFIHDIFINLFKDKKNVEFIRQKEEKIVNLIFDKFNISNQSELEQLINFIIILLGSDNKSIFSNKSKKRIMEYLKTLIFNSNNELIIIRFLELLEIKQYSKILHFNKNDIFILLNKLIKVIENSYYKPKYQSLIIKILKNNKLSNILKSNYQVEEYKLNKEVSSENNELIVLSEYNINLFFKLVSYNEDILIEELLFILNKYYEKNTIEEELFKIDILRHDFYKYSINYIEIYKFFFEKINLDFKIDLINLILNTHIWNYTSSTIKFRFNLIVKIFSMHPESSIPRKNELIEIILYYLNFIDLKIEENNELFFNYSSDEALTKVEIIEFLIVLLESEDTLSNNLKDLVFKSITKILIKQFNKKTITKILINLLDKSFHSSFFTSKQEYIIYLLISYYQSDNDSLYPKSSNEPIINLLLSDKNNISVINQNRLINFIIEIFIIKSNYYFDYDYSGIINVLYKFLNNPIYINSLQQRKITFLKFLKKVYYIYKNDSYYNKKILDIVNILDDNKIFYKEILSIYTESNNLNENTSEFDELLDIDFPDIDDLIDISESDVKESNFLEPLQDNIDISTDYIETIENTTPISTNKIIKLITIEEKLIEYLNFNISIKYKDIYDLKELYEMFHPKIFLRFSEDYQDRLLNRLIYIFEKSPRYQKKEVFDKIIKIFNELPNINFINNHKEKLLEVTELFLINKVIDIYFIFCHSRDFLSFLNLKLAFFKNRSNQVVKYILSKTYDFYELDEYYKILVKMLRTKEYSESLKQDEQYFVWSIFKSNYKIHEIFYNDINNVLSNKSKIQIIDHFIDSKKNLDHNIIKVLKYTDNLEQKTEIYDEWEDDEISVEESIHNRIYSLVIENNKKISKILVKILKYQDYSEISKIYQNTSGSCYRNLGVNKILKMNQEKFIDLLCYGDYIRNKVCDFLIYNNKSKQIIITEEFERSLTVQLIDKADFWKNNNRFTKKIIILLLSLIKSHKFSHNMNIAFTKIKKYIDFYPQINYSDKYADKIDERNALFLQEIIFTLLENRNFLELNQEDKEFLLDKILDKYKFQNIEVLKSLYKIIKDSEELSKYFVNRILNEVNNFSPVTLDIKDNEEKDIIKKIKENYQTINYNILTHNFYWLKDKLEFKNYCIKYDMVYYEKNDGWYCFDNYNEIQSEIKIPKSLTEKPEIKKKYNLINDLLESIPENANNIFTTLDKMLKDNLQVEKIVEYLGLTKEQVEAYISKLR